MLENDSKKILDNTQFLNSRKNAKIISEFDKAKRFNFLLSIFLCLAIIATLYFISDISNIYRISVKGNYYLKDEDIIALSKLDTNDKYILSFPKIIEDRINKSPLIKSCKVNLLDGRLVQIVVDEYKIIGNTNENGQSVLVLENDDRYVLDKNNMYLIENVPLLEGFTNEGLILIEKNLVDVDKKMINEISEIHYYPLEKYCDHEIIMRDGNYVFSSVYGLERINYYYDVKASYITEKNVCYYIDDISKNAIMKACPWNESKVQETNQE